MGCTDPRGESLQVIYGDVTLGVHGRGFDYIFSYSAGGPVSLQVDGKEWLYRAPRPAFWRAATDNDRGNGFPFRSAMWMGADLFTATEKIEVFENGVAQPRIWAPENNCHRGPVSAREIRIRYTYLAPTIPPARVEVGYRVSAEGDIRVDVGYFGRKGLPELPVFGLRFIMPTAARGFEYEGLAGETYPDRMAGARRGCYQVEGLPVTPYLTPQDCGVHMDTQRLTVTRASVLANERKETGEFSLSFWAVDGRNFAFSCLPYTALELESATHQEELPPARRTVVTIMGAVRGVGGIDSWGSDVERECRIDGERDMEFSFCMGRFPHS